MSDFLPHRFLRFVFPIEVQELGFLFEDKDAVKHVAQETDRNSGDGAGKVVVDAPFLQKPYQEAVAKPAHHIDHDELEQQLFPPVVEHQPAIGCEVEQDTDDVTEQRGENIRVGDVGKVDEPKERGINTPAERRIQYGYQHKTDKLRVNIPV